jgi:dTDP-4-dehydrorhamnose reductase
MIPIGRPELDLASGIDLTPVLAGARPDAIVNAAAYTAVDRAEQEPELAMAVNRDGAAAVARAAVTLNVPLIHISTDYVFSGEKDTPYEESDPTGPLGVYGQSKLAGEEEVRRLAPVHVILRTSWVYSPFGSNFVKTMLRLAATRPRISVVADQIGNPTSALDLADAVILAARQIVAAPDKAGTYHAAGSGESSWAEFAEHVFSESRRLGGPFAAVDPIRTSDYPTAARRPRNSRLDSKKFSVVFGQQLPLWKRSSGHCVQRLLQIVTS